MPDFAPSSLSSEEMQDLLHHPFERTPKGQRAAMHGVHGLPEAIQGLLRRFTGFTPLELLVEEGEFGGRAAQLTAELLKRGLIRPTLR